MRLSKRTRALLEELAGCSSMHTQSHRLQYLRLVNAGLAEETGHRDIDTFGFGTSWDAPVYRQWSYQITTKGLTELVGAPYVCAGCSTDAVWCGRPLPLKVERVGGKCTRFLCPNCYAIEEAR